MLQFILIRRIGVVLTPAIMLLMYVAMQTVSAAEFSNSLGMTFVPIPAGSYKMGAASEKPGVKFDELPQHTVKISSFQMMTTEVTVAQYKRYIIESSRINLLSDQFMEANSHGDNAPVVFVSRNDIRTFFHWLNQNKPANDIGIYRLPTEAEWEYACRAGKDTLYCGSNRASEVAWSTSKTITYQQPVASKKANAFGLYDMSGNAREWVVDCYHANYDHAPADGSVWDRDCQSNSSGVLRGGSWNEAPQGSRVTDRSALRISSRSPMIGFRAVREVR